MNVEQHRPQIGITFASMLHIMLFFLPLSYVFKAHLPSPSGASSWLAHWGLHLHLGIAFTNIYYYYYNYNNYYYFKKSCSGLVI